MKKTIVLLITSFSIASYCQSFDKMDKKELRIALKNSHTSKDSLAVINKDQENKITLMNQKLIIANDTIKVQKTRFASLLLLKNQSDENSKILNKKISILRDSIKELKKKNPFVLSSFTLKTLPKNCCLVYSETKELYNIKKNVCYWGETESDTSLILYINDEKTILERFFSDDDSDDYQYKNDKYLVKIIKRKTIKQEDVILIIESAEILIKNLSTGEKIIKQIYGEGGC